MGCVKSKANKIKRDADPRTDYRPTTTAKVFVCGQRTHKTHVSKSKNDAIRISKYAYDQTHETVRVLFEVPGIQHHPKRKIFLSASEFSFLFNVEKLNGENFSLEIICLAHEIIPAGVYYTVTNDNVHLILPKKYFFEWSSLTLTRNSMTNEGFHTEETEELSHALAESIKTIGNQYHSTGFYDKAIEEYSQAIVLYPEDAVYYSNRAASLMMLKRYEEALKDATKTIEVDKFFIKGYLRKGKIELILGRGEAALKTLRAGLEVDAAADRDLTKEIYKAAEFVSSVSKGDEAFEATNFREALRYYTTASGVATGCSNIFYKKIEVLLYCGEYNEVILSLKDQPENSEWHYFMALLNHLMGSQFDAFHHVNKALAEDPSHSKGKDLKSKMEKVYQLLDEATMAFKKDDFNKAETLMRRVIKINPMNKIINSEALSNIGLSYMRRGKYSEALGYFTQSIDLREKPFVYSLRAQCYDHLGQLQESVIDLIKVNELESTQRSKELLENAKIKLRKSKGKDYYEIFGLDSSASMEEIRKTYEILAGKFQPDYFSTSLDKTSEVTNFLELNEAYYTLSDHLKRERYDRMEEWY